MAVEFVAVSPTAYVASGASSLTIQRPAGTVEGDVMLLVTFSRLGIFAAASTDPPGRSFGNFEVIANDGTRWTTRYSQQYLLYRPVGASEPTSYTFEFTTEGGYYGAVEDDYIVGVIVAYRGAETADPVGAFDSTGDPIAYGTTGYERDPGRQFEANTFSSGGGDIESPWNASYWYTRVEGMWAVFVVMVDWKTDATVHVDDPHFTWPAPPEDVDVTFPAGWTERTPAGSWLKIADGPPATDPNFDGATDAGAGTWRGRATQSWDIGLYTLSSPTLATADTTIAGHTFELTAVSTYFPVYAGAEVVEPVPDPPVARASIRDLRVRTDPPVIIRVGQASVVASAVPDTASGGPVVLLGDDYEEQIASVPWDPYGAWYTPLFVAVLGLVTNGGSGVLVIGGGKFSGDDIDSITYAWNQLGPALGVDVTYVSGGGAIAAVSLAGYALLVVASSGFPVENGSGDAYGGLEDDEYAALVARKADILAFISAGGGLVAGQPTFPEASPLWTDPWPVCEYLSSDIALNGWPVGGGSMPSFSNAPPTPLGIALGIRSEIPHPYGDCNDPYIMYPSTLDPLAVIVTGQVTGIGALHYGGVATRGSAIAGNGSVRLRVH